MRGRPTPTNLRLIRGDPSKRRLPQNEPQPPISEEVIPPPEYLSGYAKDEWIRLARELFYLRLLTVVDINVLAAYCQAYKRWREAEEALQELATSLPLKGLMLRDRRGGALQRNPLVSIAQHACADMVRYAAEFGLTPAARARIALGPVDNRAAKFGGLLAGYPDFT
jgi:P27 family predicted phage terminase small subunit